MPLAVWLREQLRGRDKKWLIEQLVARGHTSSAAEQQVYRWTKHGRPGTAGRLSEGYVEDLTVIFGVDPRSPEAGDLGVAVAGVVADLADVRRRLDAVEARLPQPERG